MEVTISSSDGGIYDSDVVGQNERDPWFVGSLFPHVIIVLQLCDQSSEKSLKASLLRVVSTCVVLSLPRDNGQQACGWVTFKTPM